MGPPRALGGGAATPESREDWPPEFRRAVDELAAASLREELVLRPVPGPRRLAPYAVAFAADLFQRDVAVANGRLVVLHDPAGPDVWQGTTRVVTHVSADLEPEMATDPVLGAVAWSWLLDALADRAADYTAAAGTVTRTMSSRFGAMDGEPEEAQVEIRASWTPTDGRLVPHLEAWGDLLCLAAGLPPPGIVALPFHRDR